MLPRFMCDHRDEPKRWVMWAAGILAILVLLPACAARQVKPITAASKLDSAAVAASIPTVYDTVEINVVMIGDSVASRQVKLRPRSVLDVVATRDTTGTIKLVNGDTVIKELKFSSSNSTVAAADERLKTHEITTRGKSDRADSKNRWPCMIGCGGAGVPFGVPGYDTYGYSYQYGSVGTRYVDPRVGLPQNSNFGHYGATGQNVITRNGRIVGIIP